MKPLRRQPPEPRSSGKQPQYPRAMAIGLVVATSAACGGTVEGVPTATREPVPPAPTAAGTLPFPSYPLAEEGQGGAGGTGGGSPIAEPMPAGDIALPRGGSGGVEVIVDPLPAAGSAPDPFGGQGGGGPVPPGGFGGGGVAGQATDGGGPAEDPPASGVPPV